ncbi:hypothetical protein SAMN04515694_1041, partial [Leifsonia sp. CL154]
MSQVGSVWEGSVLGVTTGFTAEEIREVVHEYHLQPHGTKLAWLQARSISRDKIRRWSTAVFEGDIERSLFPRQARAMTHPGRRAWLEQQRARERAAHEAEVERLNARVQELEAV